MNGKTRDNLVVLIIKDFFGHYKLALLLVAMIIATAVAILLVTQQTRMTLNQREQLRLAQNVLQSEWRNLIVEENVLAEQKRIERYATQQLKMHYVTEKEETVVVTR